LLDYPTSQVSGNKSLFLFFLKAGWFAECDRKEENAYCQSQNQDVCNTFHIPISCLSSR
jgi:hypothetical protein